MKKKNGKPSVEVDGKPIGEQPSPEDMAERLQKLVNGKLTPPNEMVAYFVEQIRNVSKESDQVRKLLQQHRETATQLENRARELRGMQNKAVEDLKHWDSKAVEENNEPEELPPLFPSQSGDEVKPSAESEA